jgi:hypothetical protein
MNELFSLLLLVHNGVNQALVVQIIVHVSKKCPELQEKNYIAQVNN